MVVIILQADFHLESPSEKMTEIINHKDFERKLEDLPFTKLPIKKSVDVVDYSDFRFEIARRNSFINWPISFMDPRKLAAAGFYYTGESDKVKCFDCHFILGNWEKNDDPWVEHSRWSKKCRFIRYLPCGNVPINADPSLIPSETNPLDTHYSTHTVADRIPVFFSNSTFPTMMSLEELKTMKYPEYANYMDRLRSFDTWPKAMFQRQEQMAQAGFFFPKRGDQAICFYCGGGLANWDPDDIPVEEHTKWFPKCKYLQMMKNMRTMETPEQKMSRM